MAYSHEYDCYVRDRCIRIKHIDKPDVSCVWYPMQGFCVVCQKPIGPSVKYTTCGDKACIEMRNDVYYGQYLKADKYRLWRWLFNRSPERMKKCKGYSQKYSISSKGRATRREYTRNMRMWEQVKLDYGK